jgi:hypothetical protein
VLVCPPPLPPAEPATQTFIEQCWLLGQSVLRVHDTGGELQAAASSPAPAANKANQTLIAPSSPIAQRIVTTNR